MKKFTRALVVVLLGIGLGFLWAGAGRGRADSLKHPQEKHLANVKQLTFGGENAEAYFSRDGRRLIFQSRRDGRSCDQIYIMNVDGSGVKRLTTAKGYDGGAFFSLDGKKIVYRAYHPRDPQEIREYETLLRQGLVRPSRMELFVMDADGGNQRQVTNNGAANFAPYYHPNGRQIIFSSNLENPRGRNFDLYLINEDGSSLERITFDPEFDGFPMFSHDGKKLVFASNRNGKVRGETNIFIADWVP